MKSARLIVGVTCNPKRSPYSICKNAFIIYYLFYYLSIFVINEDVDKHVKDKVNLTSVLAILTTIMTTKY